MFEVINDFKEKGHNGHNYRKGETYPTEGFIADPERVSFLQSKKNKYKKAFLGKELKVETTEEAPKEKPKKKTEKKPSSKK